MDEEGSGGCCADYKQAVAERICSEAKTKDKGTENELTAVRVEMMRIVD